jgi:hypothetical protein
MSTTVRERVGDDLIRRLRQKVCEAVAQTPFDDYDAQDLEVNIKSSDTLILMFAGQYMDDHGIKSLNSEEPVEDKVVERIKNLVTDALKWRKQQDVANLTLSDFSSEFFSRGFYRIGISGPNDDKVTIVMDFGKHKKISSAVNRMEMAYFFVFTERITKEHFSAGRDVTVIFDHTNYGLANMDASFMIDFFSLISSYYPTIIARTIAYELPWYLKPVVTMAQAVLPSRITKDFAVVDRNSIKQKLDKEQIPVWMGGECECNLLTVSTTKELHEVAARYGVTDSDLQKLNDYYSKTTP